MATSRTLDIKISLPAETPLKDEELEARAREGAILALWQAGALSIREAAASLGLEYYDFLDLLAQHNIPIIAEAPDQATVEEAWHRLQREGIKKE